MRLTVHMYNAYVQAYSWHYDIKGRCHRNEPSVCDMAAHARAELRLAAGAYSHEGIQTAYGVTSKHKGNIGKGLMDSLSD